MDTPEANITRTYRWFIFSILSFCYILVNFHRLCPAVLAVDLMRDLNATGTLTGLLSSAYFYSYALMQLPAGLLSDSWGPRKTITLFFVIAGAGSILLGMASTVALAIAGRALVGLGVAMVFVPTMKILTKWFHTSEFAFMASVLLGMGGVGTLSAAAPLVWLNSLIGWRNAFISIGGLTLVLALIVWLFVRNSPKEFGWPPPYTSMPDDHPSEGGLLKNAKTVLATPAFWPLGLWFFCNIGVFFAFGGLWGGPYLQHVYHLEKSQAGFILSMLSIGLVLGNPFFSVLSDKVFHKRKAVIILANVVLILIMVLFYVKTDTITVPFLYPLFFLFSVFSVALSAIGFTMNKEMFPVAMSGTATGLINLFPFAGGAFFQPLLGRVLESHGKDNGMFTLAGYKAMFLVLLIAAVISFLAALFLKETIAEDENT